MRDNSSLLKIGEIVEVMMGRESGKLAIVLKIANERYLLIADGDKRKFDKPKRKNFRHLKSTGYISKEIVDSLKESNKVSNAKLRYILQKYISSHLNEDDEKGE